MLLMRASRTFGIPYYCDPQCHSVNIERVEFNNNFIERQYKQVFRGKTVLKIRLESLSLKDHSRLK